MPSGTGIKNRKARPSPIESANGNGFAPFHTNVDAGGVGADELDAAAAADATIRGAELLLIDDLAFSPRRTFDG